MHIAIIESESGNLIESESVNLIESESPENAGTKNSSTALRQHIKNRPDQPNLERSKLAIVNRWQSLISIFGNLPASEQADGYCRIDVTTRYVSWSESHGSLASKPFYSI